MCTTQNSLLLNQHNGDDAPQDEYSGYKLTYFTLNKTYDANNTSSDKHNFVRYAYFILFL
jgi:hypothetical protein